MAASEVLTENLISAKSGDLVTNNFLQMDPSLTDFQLLSLEYFTKPILDYYLILF